MKIFIDESGDFNTKLDEGVSVLVGIVVPENKEYKLINFFEKLNKRLTLKEKDANGEIKGCLMDEKNVEYAFSFLSANRDFRIVVQIFDNQINSPENIKWHRIEQAKRFQKGKELYFAGPAKGKEVLDFFDEKKRWAERDDIVSDVLFVQLTLQVSIIREAMQKILVHYHADNYKKVCFEGIDVVIDRKNKKMKQPEKYISDVLLGFLENQRSGRENWITIDKIGKKDHPFSKFDIEIDGHTATDLKKLFGKGISFEDSKKFLGIQLADIVASNIRRIILGNINKELFNLIRPNCGYFKNKWNAVNICSFREKGTLASEKGAMYTFLQKAPKNTNKLI